MPTYELFLEHVLTNINWLILLSSLRLHITETQFWRLFVDTTFRAKWVLQYLILADCISPNNLADKKRTLTIYTCYDLQKKFTPGANLKTIWKDLIRYEKYGKESVEESRDDVSEVYSIVGQDSMKFISFMRIRLWSDFQRFLLYSLLVLFFKWQEWNSIS